MCEKLFLQMTKTLAQSMPCSSHSKRINSATLMAGWVSFKWMGTLSAKFLSVSFSSKCRARTACIDAVTRKYCRSKRSLRPAGVLSFGEQHPQDIFEFVFHAGRARVVVGVEGGQVDVRGEPSFLQAQGAHARRAVAWHHHVIGLRSNFSRRPPHRFGTLVFNPPTKANRVADLSARKLPRGAVGKPGVGLFNLAVFDDLLREPAEFVTDAVAKRRQTLRGHRI